MLTSCGHYGEKNLILQMYLENLEHPSWGPFKKLWLETGNLRKSSEGITPSRPVSWVITTKPYTV